MDDFRKRVKDDLVKNRIIEQMNHPKYGYACDIARDGCIDAVMRLILENERLTALVEKSNLEEHEADHDRQKAWDYADELKTSLSAVWGTINELTAQVNELETSFKNHAGTQYAHHP